MPIINGLTAPGALVTAKLDITADVAVFLAAASGRRIVGYHVRQTGSYGIPARGFLLKGTSLVAGATNVIGSWELASGGQQSVALAAAAGGVDVDQAAAACGGACVDFQAGQFDLTVFYVDVT